MKNSVNSLSFILLIFVFSNIYAQDYFDDANGNGFPIVYGDSLNLLSGRVNTTDNSIKINLFSNILMSGWSNTALIENQTKRYLGWGLFVKGKAENGLSNLIRSGDLQPGFNTGGYLSYEYSHFTINNNIPKYYYMKFILSFSYNYSNLNIYDPTMNFSNQLYDTNFYGYSLGFSGFIMPPLPKDDIFLGFSVSATRTNNYSSLDKYEVKDIKNVIDSTGTIIRQVTGDKDNYLYASGKFKEYIKYGVRINIDYIPAFLNYRAGFILYPSMEFQDQKKPKYNLGMSLNFLKEKAPLLADAGIFLELNDLTNIADSKEKFFKRSFRLGLSAAWNILTNEKGK